MRKAIPLFFVFVVLVASFPFAQEPYKLPSKKVVDNDPMPSIAYMSQPLLRLAGSRITPLNNSRQQTTFYTSITIKRMKDGVETSVVFPENVKLGFPRWSYDRKWIAVIRYLENGVELWAIECRTGEAKALTGPIVNATLTSGFTWLPDNQHLLVHTVMGDRGAPPEKPAVPVGPNIQEATGKFAKVWTYQDLLKDPFDEKLFTYYTTSQLIKIDVRTGKSQKFGKSGIYLSTDPAPNGELVLIHKIKKPYSYGVPYYYFTHSKEVWDKNGTFIHLVADIPLADDVPMRGVPKGPRRMEWRALRPATLVWVEALDEGDPENDVPHRDKLMTQSYPFQDTPREVLKTQYRYDGLSWMETPGEALLTEYDWKRRWRTTYHINVDDLDKTHRKIFDLSVHDRYNSPGYPVYTSTPKGEYLIIKEKDWVYFDGSGASPEGDFPFLDRLNLKTMEKRRLFQCGQNSYETFIDFVGDSRTQIVTSYESKTEPPNYYVYDLKNQKRVKLSDYKDPAPQMMGLKKQLIKYEREDGVQLSGTLYLPPDYKEGEKRPLVVWAYPREYTDPRVAGQVRGSENRFTFFRGTSQLFFLTQGYVVLDGAQMPIIGDPKTMNDTFVEQLVGNAKAAIDKVNSMGYIDPERVGIGGHSYGAFMTANLLAHSDLFAAGVARSGAYNRTLTPFGFQNERRTVWEAPEVYFKVSPFLHADKINEPILLIHGEIDNNSGTFPIQSRRLFHALKGHGATVRLVFLPHESHGYRAEESILHVLAEQFEWFDKYVKR
ncbi:MAG: prolyl oligopeptidase family serine peptidase [Candidatus Aminicenantes bacterium]|jgi:dipeptidyl aminopeptidase/acylaminoacyl peptidase